MNILSRMCNAGRGDIVGNLARQNIPLWSWCNSKPSLPGLIHPSFHPRTEEIPAHFLPPFNTTLAKITIRLIKFIFAALPLRNFAIKIEFALILYLIKTLFAKFMFVSRCLIVNLTLPFPSWQTVRGCCFTSQPILGRILDSRVPQGKQKPYVKGTSATQKQSVPSASDMKLLPFVCCLVFFSLSLIQKRIKFKNICLPSFTERYHLHYTRHVRME